MSPCGPGGTHLGGAMGRGSLIGEKPRTFITNCIANVEAHSGKTGDYVGLCRKIVD